MKRDISTIFWDNLTDYKRRHYSIPEEELEELKSHIIDINTELALSYIKNKKEGPCLGDYLILPDGRIERFTNIYPDRVQAYENSAYYLGEDGSIDHSGTCGEVWDRSYVFKTRRKKVGQCRVWDRGRVGASLAVPVSIPFDVYVYCKNDNVEKFEQVIGERVDFNLGQHEIKWDLAHKIIEELDLRPGSSFTNSEPSELSQYREAITGYYLPEGDDHLVELHSRYLNEKYEVDFQKAKLNLCFDAFGIDVDRVLMEIP